MKRCWALLPGSGLVPWWVFEVHFLRHPSR
jgi:hypothetical protein